MRRYAGRAAVLAALLAATAGCASNQEKALDRALDDMRVQLSEISDSADRLIATKSAKRTSERIDYLYGPFVYDYDATELEATWKIVVTDDASYSEFIGAHQVSVGTCITMTATKASGVEAHTVDCPKGLWKRDDVDSFNDEVDILNG